MFDATLEYCGWLANRRDVGNRSEDERDLDLYLVSSFVIIFLLPRCIIVLVNRPALVRLSFSAVASSSNARNARF